MPHRTAAVGALLFLGMAGCSAAGGDGTVAPEAAFSYRVPPHPVTYLRSDTLGLEMTTPTGGAMNLQFTTNATLGVAFAPTAGGLEVSMRFRELSARMTDPMGGTTTVGAEGIDGPLVFRINPRGGDVEIMSRPTLDDQARGVVSPLSLAHEFLPRLPGAPVPVGSSWVDTTSYQGSEGEQDVEATIVTTYTLAGDTAVDGRTVQRIDAVGSEEFSATGRMQGTEFSQSLSGTREGVIFWDSSTGVMVMSELHRELDGSMEIPAAGIPPLTMSASGVTRTVLR